MCLPLSVLFCILVPNRRSVYDLSQPTIAPTDKRARKRSEKLKSSPYSLSLSLSLSNTMASPKVTTIPPKPPSNMYSGYGRKGKSIPFTTISDLHTLRDNFTISTWLLIGASLQCLLLALPIRPSYALIPALSLLGYRFTHWLLQCFGIIPHPYADGVIEGKLGAAYPATYSDEIDGKKKDDGGVCVIMLFARCHRYLPPCFPHLHTEP